jgi:hypothetical protein
LVPELPESTVKTGGPREGIHASGDDEHVVVRKMDQLGHSHPLAADPHAIHEIGHEGERVRVAMLARSRY